MLSRHGNSSPWSLRQATVQSLRLSPSFMRHRPLVNSLGTYRKEAQVLPLKTYADKKRSLIFILGQRTDSGENQHGQVHSDHWCLRPPSGVLLGLLWGSCPESAFSQISQLFESYHPSNRKGNQWLERWSLKCGPQTSSISIIWEGSRYS